MNSLSLLSSRVSFFFPLPPPIHFSIFSLLLLPLLVSLIEVNTSIGEENEATARRQREVLQIAKEEGEEDEANEEEEGDQIEEERRIIAAARRGRRVQLEKRRAIIPVPMRR